MNQWFPWFEFYHAYIWVGGSSDSTPMFSSLSIDLMSSSGYWATGQFLLSGFDWAVHPNAFYSLYLVEPRAIPIVSIPLAELR